MWCQQWPLVLTDPVSMELTPEFWLAMGVVHRSNLVEKMRTLGIKVEESLPGRCGCRRRKDEGNDRREGTAGGWCVVAMPRSC